MSNRLRALLLSSLLALAGTGQASELDLSLAEDVFRGMFVTALDPQGKDGGAVFDFGGLFMEGESDDAIIGHAGLLVYGDAGARKANVQAGIGVRGIVLDADPSVRGLAVALGGAVSARMPDVDRVGASVWAYFAPDVTAFEDLSRYLEYGVTLDYQLIRRATIYAGYRQVEIKTGRGPVTEIDSGIHGGVRLSF